MTATGNASFNTKSSGRGGPIRWLVLGGVLLAITGALTKGAVGVYGVNIADAGGFGALPTYTLVTFTGGTTFVATDFTLSALPGGFTGTLQLGPASLDLLLAQIRSGHRLGDRRVLTPTLISRDSVAPFRG